MLAMVVLLVVVAVVVAAAAAVISSPLLAVAVVVAVVLVLVVMLVLLVLVLLLVLTLADVATKPAERPPLPVVLFRHSPVAPVVALKQLHCCKIAMLNLIADTGTPVCVCVCVLLSVSCVCASACVFPKMCQSNTWLAPLRHASTNHLRHTSTIHCSHDIMHQVNVTNAQVQQRTACCGVARCCRILESQRAAPKVIEEHGARKAPNKVVVVVVTHVVRQWWHAFGRSAVSKYCIPPGAARTVAFSIGATALRWMIPSINKPAVLDGPIERGPLIFGYPSGALLCRTPNCVVGVGGQRCEVIPSPIEDQTFWGPHFHLHPVAVS